MAAEVRLVSPDGEQIGIKRVAEALEIARSFELDLVEVAPGADPPVCRIMDYGKYKYEAAQRAKESRRKSSHAGLKEMKYRPKIGRGDFNTKTTKVHSFLKDGHKVKVTIMFRGREVYHPELGRVILERVADAVLDIGKVDQFPKLDGRNMTMVLSPDRQSGRKKKSFAEMRRAAEGEAANVAGVAGGDAVAGGDGVTGGDLDAGTGVVDGSTSDNGSTTGSDTEASDTEATAEVTGAQA